MKKFILFFIILTFVSCGKSKEEVKEAKSPKPVVFEVVKSEKDTITREYSGVITSKGLSNLSFRVSGTINDRIADLGDSVKKGDVLATLDPTEYKLKYKQALAELNKSKALLVDFQADFKRSQALYLENSISKASYEEAVASLKSNESSVSALKENVNLAKLQLDYTSLIAPGDGTIGGVKSEVNESVTPDSAVFILNTTGEKYIEFNVSQDVVGALKVNQDVKIKINSLNNLILNGSISNIGTISTGFGNTYPVKVKLNDSQSDLIKIGMIGSVSIDISKNKKDIVKIPISSVLTDSENNRYVYVVKKIDKKNGVAAKQIVTLGDVTTTDVIIKDGLSSGDYIITKGSSNILPDEAVFLMVQGDEKR